METVKRRTVAIGFVIWGLLCQAIGICAANRRQLTPRGVKGGQPTQANERTGNQFGAVGRSKEKDPDIHFDRPVDESDDGADETDVCHRFVHNLPDFCKNSTDQSDSDGGSDGSWGQVPEYSNQEGTSEISVQVSIATWGELVAGTRQDQLLKLVSNSVTKVLNDYTHLRVMDGMDSGSDESFQDRMLGQEVETRNDELHTTISNIRSVRSSNKAEGGKGREDSADNADEDDHLVTLHWERFGFEAQNFSSNNGTDANTPIPIWYIVTVAYSARFMLDRKQPNQVNASALVVAHTSSRTLNHSIDKGRFWEELQCQDMEDQFVHDPSNDKAPEIIPVIVAVAKPGEIVVIPFGRRDDPSTNRTFTERVSTNWETREWVGLGLCCLTLLTSTLLAIVSGIVQRRRYASMHSSPWWRLTENGVGEVLQVGWRYQVEEGRHSFRQNATTATGTETNRPRTEPSKQWILQIFDKSGVGYTDDDSMLKGEAVMDATC